MSEATTTVIVPVRRKHIKAGKRGDPKCCAVALALCDVGFSHPRIWDRRVDIGNYYDGKGTTTLRIPDTVCKWLSDFDQSKDNVGPMAFAFTVPTRFIRPPVGQEAAE